MHMNTTDMFVLQHGLLGFGPTELLGIGYVSIQRPNVVSEDIFLERELTRLSSGASLGSLVRPRIISRSTAVEGIKFYMPLSAPYLPIGTERANSTLKSKELKWTMAKPTASSMATLVMEKIILERASIRNGMEITKSTWSATGKS